jgi:hypothetical protein
MLDGVLNVENNVCKDAKDKYGLEETLIYCCH